MKNISPTLILLGLLVSGYLLYRHGVVAEAAVPRGVDFCSIVFGAGCDETLKSPLSTQFGLPLAGWGLVLYTAMGTLLLLGYAVGDDFRFEATLAALLLDIAAAAASVALFTTMVTGFSPFCPMCAVVHGVNLALLYPLKRMTGRSLGESARAVVAAGRYLLGGKVADRALARWRIVGLLTAALAAAVVYLGAHLIVLRNESPAEGPVDLAKVYDAFRKGPQVDIPVDPGDPRRGPENAPVRLVVFSDFQCPGCIQFSRVLTRLTEQFAAKLEVVFKQFPLSSDCNPAAKQDIHPGACEAAMAAEAAQRQGKFWLFHDRAFAYDLTLGEVSLEEIAAQVGLDTERFEADRHGPEAAAAVRADVELGIQLGLHGTPTVFVNGRRVEDLNLPILQAIIANEIRRADQPATGTD